MKRLMLSLAAVFSMVLSACGGQSATGVPDINYGRDICIECGMIIDDPRFAAAYRLEDGTEKTFDDLGGLIINGRESGELEVATVWVSDFEAQVLIEAGPAYFVPTLGVSSPMGHGILAFATRDRAEAVAAELHGEVLRWEQVKVLPVLDGLLGDHHSMDGSMDHEMGADG